MAAFFVKSVSAFLFFILALLPGLNARAENFSTDARYVVTLRGLNIAQVDINFSNQNGRYKVNINGDVAGLASFVSAGTAQLNSKGSSFGPQLQSENFDLKTQSNGESFHVNFQAQNAKVSSFQVAPPLKENKNRVPVRAEHRQNINDPIAAFLIKNDNLSAEVCNRTLPIYTGVERYDIVLKFAQNQQATSNRTGYQGPVVLCRMEYNPISGHFTNSNTTNYMKSNQRFLIWYAPLKNKGYVIPYRVLIGTAFGDLSMVLTRLDAK